MRPDDMQIYRRIICEQITLQELQERQTRAHEDPLGLARRIKHQRRLVGQLWAAANAFNDLKPLR